ncbi:MAG TPA: hypothetical protein VN455_13600, partial [Methanotrichaceae archaeon]|nr:hypothetical protein [Methanotrichaceae archaeon]
YSGCVLSLAVFLLLGAAAAQSGSDLNIDYSHSVTGTGTILTDYQMGTDASSEASGAIRGTGDVVNNYFFSTNNSTLFTVEDQFQLSKKPEQSAARTVKTSRPKYPQWPGKAGSFRLTGTKWAGNIEVAAFGDSAKKAPSKKKAGDASGGKFEFNGAGLEGTVPAKAVTTISDPAELDVNAALAVGGPRSDQSFSYRSIWQTSRNVTVKSSIGQPHEMLYEDDAWIAGDTTGKKNLKVY